MPRRRGPLSNANRRTGADDGRLTCNQIVMKTPRRGCDPADQEMAMVNSAAVYPRSLDANSGYSVSDLTRCTVVSSSDASEVSESGYLHKKFNKKIASSSSAEGESQSTPLVTQDPTPPEAAGGGGGGGGGVDAGKNVKDCESDPNCKNKPGRYICSYCQHACAKPSVLEKHIRAHTNERPYPCVPCGFAFKTKSNLYKHRKSRTHVLKMEEGGGALHPQPDDLSQTSDTSDENDVSDDVESDPNSSQVPSQTSPSTPDRFKTPYKPKFHIWKSADEPRPEEKSTPEQSAARRPPQSPSPGFLQARISQIISENQAIVESSDPIWARRFVRQSSRDKDSTKPRMNTSASTVPVNPKTQQQHGLVNRERSCSFSSSNGESREAVRNSVLIPPEEEELHRKRCYSEGRVSNSDSYSVRSLLQTTAWQGPPPKELQEHVNPEGSLIKDLLLKSRMAAAESNRVNENPKASLSFSVSAILQNGPGPGPGPDFAAQKMAEASRAAHVTPEKSVEKPVLVPEPENHSPTAKRRKFETMGSASREQQQRTSVLLRSFSVDPSTSHSGYQKNEPRPSSALDYRPPQFAGLANPFGTDSIFQQPPSRTPSLQLCGGEVEICEGDKKRVMRIDPVGFTPEPDPSSYAASSTASSASHPHDTSVVVMKNKSGLNTGGGTVQVQSRDVRPITSALPLSLMSPVGCKPAANSESGLVLRMDSQSAFTEVSKTRIPYVPGIPGPYSAASALSPVSEVPSSFALPAAAKSSSSFVVPEITVSPAIGDLEQHPDGCFGGGRSKFLRPNTLPLKPGTFQLKRTNMAGVDGAGKPHLVGSGAGMTLVSPETPRPHKLYRQMFLNGHAYTYLGLKCSTRVYFCCLSKPQPMYVHQGDSKLSMYSQWQTRPCPAESSPCGLSPVEAMGLYDSRHHTGTYTIASPREGTRLVLTHSSYWTNRDRPVITTTNPVVANESAEEKKESPETSASSGVETSVSSESPEPKEQQPKRVRIFAGGFKSNEDYTYVRGRGRGRYVCEECGIRCKKPSMLKKHIRTHTDLRPYTCRQCNFSFKTKGNLTKHMKSKAHHKKCTELGISPVPTSVEESNIDEESLARQEKMKKIAGSVDDSELEEEEDDEDEDDEDMDEEEDEADCDSGSAEAVGQFEDADEVPVREEREQEVARSLLDLGVIARSGSKPTTYPYAINNSASHGENPFEDEPMETTPPPEIEESPKNFSPMDLSVTRHPSEAARHLPDTPQEPQTILSPVTETSSLLASIYMTAQRAVEASGKRNITPEPSENEMLHAYIKEKALKEGQIKRQQLKEVAVRPLPPVEEKSAPVEVPLPAPVIERMSVISSASSVAPAPAVVVCSSGEGMIPKPRNESSAASAGAPLAQTQVFKMTDDGKTACSICNKVFTKPSQLRLHINIHYFERPFRCDSCAVSFRTKGHLQKHKRSVTHFNKVNMNLTFGTPSTENPRPFKCSDCMIAFRIHGHLAKHLRSKMHIMKLECLGKLPFGTYAEIERSGVNLNEIDTTDCHNSLESLQSLAHRLYKQDPGKLQQWQQESTDASGRQRTISGSSEEFSDLADDGEEDEDAEDSDGLPCPDVTEALRVEDPVPPEASDPQPFANSESYQSQPREIHPPPPEAPPSTPPPPPVAPPPQTVREPKTSPWRPVPESSRQFYPPSNLPMLPRTDAYPPYVNPMPGMRPTWTQDPNAVAWMASRGLMLPIPMPGVNQMHGYLPPGHLHMMNGAAPHAEESSYPCELCGKIVAGKEAFHQHMMTHAQPRPFVCEYCDAGFTTQQHLESHLTLHRQQAN